MPGWSDTSGPPDQSTSGASGFGFTYGSEGAYGASVGQGLVTLRCKDGNGCSHRYVYRKYCVGAWRGIAGGGGMVTGIDCKDPSTYAGWFKEGSWGAVNVAIGYNQDGELMEADKRKAFGNAPTRWPGTEGPAFEVGLGVSLYGFRGRAAYCFYVYVPELSE
jgi:hypothetical protein